MTRAEEMIEMLENKGFVVVNVKYANGSVADIEMVEDDMEDVVAIEVATVEAYEENGYEVEGLSTEWKEI